MDQAYGLVPSGYLDGHRSAGAVESLFRYPIPGPGSRADCKPGWPASTAVHASAGNLVHGIEDSHGFTTAWSAPRAYKTAARLVFVPALKTGTLQVSPESHRSLTAYKISSVKVILSCNPSIKSGLWSWGQTLAGSFCCCAAPGSIRFCSEDLHVVINVSTTGGCLSQELNLLDVLFPYEVHGLPHVTSSSTCWKEKWILHLEQGLVPYFLAWCVFSRTRRPFSLNGAWYRPRGLLSLIKWA